MTSSVFQLWPAIDIINAKPVRLHKGDYNQKTEYTDSFEALAHTFSQCAHGIHVVDLDGAKAQKPVNIDAIQKIVESSSVPVEVGGGIRSLEDLSLLFSLGVSRCILGTSAVKDMQFLEEALEKYGSEKIVVGVDTHNGNVATHGWEKTSSLSATEFMHTLEKKGVQTVIYTDISTDGTLQGPPLALFTELVAEFPHLEIIASGGVAKASDLQDLQKVGVAGSIFGKAYYEGHITEEDLKNILL